MTMPTSPESSIFDSAALVMLHSGARPMVDGVAQAGVSGLSHENDFALARSLADWRDTRQASQGVVISPSQRIRGFCEQRGEDDPSNAWQGCEDLHVMLLRLPRSGLFRRNEPGGQSIELAMRLLELLVQEPDVRNERRDVRACGLSCSCGDLHRRLAQHVQDERGIQAPDAITLQNLGDRRLSDADRFIGRRHGLPQVEQPLRPEIAFEIEDCWKIAPELLSQAICEAVAVGAEVFGDARPLAQFDDGSATASGRKQRGSVRRAEAITSASRLSSLAPASVKRSRKRSICFGLMT